MRHRYRTNCSLITSKSNYYSLAAMLYLVLAYWWCKRVSDFEQYEDMVEGGSLQKCLTVIPLMKLIQVTCYTAYAGSCPW